MIAKQATFDLLNGYPFNVGFSLKGLAYKVGNLIDRPEIYPSTVGRYCRLSRGSDFPYNWKIVLVSKKESKYRKEMK